MRYEEFNHMRPFKSWSHSFRRRDLVNRRHRHAERFPTALKIMERGGKIRVVEGEPITPRDAEVRRRMFGSEDPQ